MISFPTGLIVSCQALEGNPLRDSEHLARMARSAELGGARAIRANGEDDIRAIRAAVHLPIIGIDKVRDATGRVVITPDFESARRVARAGADIIALDVTFQPSDLREEPGRLIERIHRELDMPVMADISCLEEARQASLLGADAVSTTLSGYLPNKGYPASEKYVPDMKLLERLIADDQVHCPVIAEGRFWRIEDLRAALALGVTGVVIGKAVTNPMAITTYFASAWQV